MSQPDPDPLARFLGFDPTSGYGLARSRPPEAPAPRVIVVAPPPPPPVPVEAPAPLNLAGLSTATLRDALDGNPREVLLLACKAIFRQTKADQKGNLPSGGRFGEVKRATEWAMQELAGAPGFRDDIQRSGWIVGKASNRHT